MVYRRPNRCTTLRKLDDDALRLNETAVSWREVDGEIIALQHQSSEYLSTKGSGALLGSPSQAARPAST